MLLTCYTIWTFSQSSEKKAFKSYDCLDSLPADVGTRGIGLNYLFDRTAYNCSRNNFGTILNGIHRASADVRSHGQTSPSLIRDCCNLKNAKDLFNKKYKKSENNNLGFIALISQTPHIYARLCITSFLRYASEGRACFTRVPAVCFLSTVPSPDRISARAARHTNSCVYCSSREVLTPSPAKQDRGLTIAWRLS